MCSTVLQTAAALADALAAADAAAGWAGAGRAMAAEAEVVELATAAELVRRAMFPRLALIAAEHGVPEAVEVLVRSGWAFGPARREVELAVGLHGPTGAAATASALEAGAIGTAQAAVIVAALRRLPTEQAGEVEAVLLHAAAQLDPTTLTRVARHAVRLAAEQADPGRLDDVTEARRQLHVCPTLDGSVLLHGTLTPACGEALMSALAPLAEPAPTGPHGSGDSRSAPQRRHDALEELCRRVLDAGTLPEQAGLRPQVAVTVDLEDLRAPGAADRPSAGACRFGWTGTASAMEARLTACDATLVRLVLDRPDLDGLAAAITDHLPPALAGSPRQVLDVGRATRLISPALRKALAARDRGCAWVGCAVPAQFCEAHHIVHWADGGPTTLANLSLRCRRHHRAEHREHDWRARAPG